MLARILSGGFAILLGGASAHAATLTVKVEGVPNDNGTVRVSLHNGSQGFPGKRAPVAMIAAKARSGTVSIKLDGIRPGTYAVAVFHDENGNEKLDANLVGMPTERYGFSKNARGTFGPPKFGSAAFAVGQADMTISINVR